MNTSTKLAGTGVALIVGSLLSISTVALGAGPQPTKVCLEDTSPGNCETSTTTTTTLPGGSGEEVAVFVPEIFRSDAKDHPNYGQITPVVRPDAKDHPNYGQITADVRGGNAGVGPSRSMDRNFPV